MRASARATFCLAFPLHFRLGRQSGERTVAYYILARILVAQHGSDSTLARALGKDFKGIVSVVVYAIAIALAFVYPWAACALYVVVAIMWLIPDPRIEHQLVK